VSVRARALRNQIPPVDVVHGDVVSVSGDWKPAVEEEIRRAAFIFVSAGGSPGLEWELDLIFSDDSLLARAMILVPIDMKNTIRCEFDSLLARSSRPPAKQLEGLGDLSGSIIRFTPDGRIVQIRFDGSVLGFEQVLRSFVLAVPDRRAAA